MTAPASKLSGGDGASITALLEARIARLSPTLTRADRTFAVAHVRAGLMAMVRDEAACIRGIMKEQTRSMPQWPGNGPVEVGGVRGAAAPRTDRCGPGLPAGQSTLPDQRGLTCGAPRGLVAADLRQRVGPGDGPGRFGRQPVGARAARGRAEQPSWPVAERDCGRVCAGGSGTKRRLSNPAPNGDDQREPAPSIPSRMARKACFRACAASRLARH